MENKVKKKSEKGETVPQSDHLYSKFYETYKRFYSSESSKQKVQNNCNALWHSLKADRISFPNNAQEKIDQWRIKIQKREEINRRMFPTKTIPSVVKTASNSLDTLPTFSASDGVKSGTDQDRGSKKRKIEEVDDSSDEGNSDPLQVKKYATPVQDALKDKIVYLNKQLRLAKEGRDSGLAPPNVQDTIKKYESDLKECEKKLTDKEKRAAWSRSFRQQRSEVFKKMKVETPGLAKHLHIREEVGRPSIDCDQPDILKAIVDIAMFGSAADDRRRTNLINTCKTLKQLREALLDLGYEISESGTYLRLRPRNSQSIQGRRHVRTVNVKLRRAQNDARKQHRDGKFCTASIRSVEAVISTLGSHQVSVISQDDKSQVPIGVTAANKQAPFLMHMEYQVRLPDHDWVVAPKHKFIPSVYAGIVIKEGKIGDPSCVGYSGPTHIVIRSAKHCSSTASTHAFDFERLLHLDSFKEIFYGEDEDQLKPVHVVFTDGGPDENPRYPKNIAHWIDIFILHGYDCIIVITNAPGLSSFNRVERRMAPLSRELSGLILPHEYFGSHLNNSGKTIDDDLELKNFEYAGDLLAKVWSRMVIDGYPVSADHANSEWVASAPDDVNAEWYQSHVQESQYFLQIAKCSDKDCCGEWRSNLKDILPLSNGFLPPPFPLRRSSTGLLIIPSPKDVQESDSFPDLFFRQSLGIRPYTVTGLPVPYDFYCPSIRDEVEGRMCHICGVYFASKIRLSTHMRALHNVSSLRCSQRTKRVVGKRGRKVLCELNDTDLLQPIMEWLEEDEIEYADSFVLDSVTTGGGLSEYSIPIISDLGEYLLSAFEDVDN